jgi:hypothetical protein
VLLILLKYLKLSMQASWPQMQPEIEKVLEVVALGDIGEGMETGAIGR